MVSDVNDNQPIFSKAKYIAKVPEDTSIGTVVTTVSATDADVALNGQIEYQRIADSYSGRFFSIDTKTGAITLIRALDYDRGRKTFRFDVTAFDKGMPPNHVNAQVQIDVTDVNDNAPRFTQRKYNPYPTDRKHTSELQSHSDLVCRLLLEKKNHTYTRSTYY